MGEKPLVRAVLFDLDDTLFDHRASAGDALRRVQDSHECLRTVPFAEVEEQHSRLLEDMHPKVVGGELGMDDARVERFRQLLVQYGDSPTDAVCRAAAAMYRREYLAARRATAGAEALLTAVRNRAAVAVVSNNMLQEQVEKLEFCRLTAHVDALIVSEEIGVSKPDPAIFRAALEAVGATPSEAVMIGDSWTADVLGARAAGIRPIWFNPLDLPAPDPRLGVSQIRTLEASPRTLALIFGS
jgi:putative hydrolase of the HAD superfamily